MQYYTYGWPANVSTFDIEFYDCLRGTTATVQTAYRQNRITYGASAEQPGLLLVYPNYTSGRTRPYTFPVNQAPSLATLRWRIRDAMNDTEDEDGVDFKFPETPKWKDREIDSYLRDGIGWLNRYAQAEYLIDTTLDLYRDDLLERATEVINVSFYDTDVNEWISLPRYSRRGHRGTFHYWDIVGSKLTLYGTFPDDAKLEIKYQAPYRIPSTDLSLLMIAEDDWDILSLYGQARCYMRLAGQSAQLDRWKEEGKRNDNPVTPIARMLMQQAEDRLKNRRGPRAIRRFRG